MLDELSPERSVRDGIGVGGRTIGAGVIQADNSPGITKGLPFQWVFPEAQSIADLEEFRLIFVIFALFCLRSRGEEAGEAAEEAQGKEGGDIPVFLQRFRHQKEMQVARFPQMVGLHHVLQGDKEIHDHVGMLRRGEAASHKEGGVMDLGYF